MYKGQEVNSGDWFSCKINGVAVEGRVYISVNPNILYLMQNHIKGDKPIKGLQYNYEASWGIYNINEPESNSVFDLIITPYTDKKEFKWGDKVKINGDSYIFCCVHPKWDDTIIVIDEYGDVGYDKTERITPYQPNTHTLPDGRVINLDTLEEKNFIK